jgi:hypothetical protein
MSQCLSCALTGEQYLRDDMPWGYVFKIGSARQITEWTLAQSEKQKVVDALTTLSNITIVRPSEAKDAVDGYVAVHRKLLEGWPGVDGPWPPDPAPGMMKSVLEFSRHKSYRETQLYPDNAALLDLWQRVSKMDPGAVEDYRQWRAKKE